MATSNPKSGAAQGGVGLERTRLAHDPPPPVHHDPRGPFNLYRGLRNRQSNRRLEPAFQVPEIEGLVAGAGPVGRLAVSGEHRGEPLLFGGPLPRRRGGESGADLEEPHVGDMVGPVPLHQSHQPGSSRRRR